MPFSLNDPWVLAGLSSLASLYSSSENIDSVEDAVAKNIARLMEENATREKLFHEARGAAGHAILPEYFGDQEANLAGDVTANFERMMNQGSAAERQQFYNDLMAKYRPIMDAGDDTMGSVYDGTLRSERMDNLQPVLDARLAAAEAQTTAYDRAMAETQAAIRGEQASKGYVGGGTTQNRMLLGSNVANAQRIAELMSGARYQNEVDRLRVNDEDVNLRLASMPLISRQARDSASLQNLPIEAESNRLGAAMAPFNFFKLPYDRFEPTPGNDSVPIPSMGALVGDGVSQFINTYNEQLGSQDFINKLGALIGTPDNPGGAMDFGKIFQAITDIINPTGTGSAPTPGTGTEATPGSTATPGQVTTPAAPAQGIDLTPTTTFPSPEARTVLDSATYDPLAGVRLFDQYDRSNQYKTFNVGFPMSGFSSAYGFPGFSFGDNEFSIGFNLGGMTGKPRFIQALP